MASHTPTEDNSSGWWDTARQGEDGLVNREDNWTAHLGKGDVCFPAHISLQNKLQMDGDSDVATETIPAREEDMGGFLLNLGVEKASPTTTQIQRG